MTRHLFSASRNCPYRCLYCFTEIPRYVPQPLLFSSLRFPDYAIIYPTCDGELPLDADVFDRLEKLISGSSGPLVVTASTKSSLNTRTVERLTHLNRILNYNGGFLKISISFSTSSMISKIEPGTATYSRRLQNLSRLADLNIPLSVTIKPILPFVAQHEYFDLVIDARRFTDCFLLGDLYVDRSSRFFAEYLAPTAEALTIRDRPVGWLNNQPTWSVVECQQKKNEIASLIRREAGLAFENDIALIDTLRQRFAGARL